MTEPNLTPRLIVKDADAAIAFYQATLGAELLERYHDRHIDKVVHAALSIEGSIISLTEEAPDFHNRGPDLLGGTSVLLQLRVDDPDATASAMQAAGAEVIFEVRDQFYGRREGRLRDPFGHMWILSKPIADLSPDEIQRRVDHFHA